MDLSQLSKHAGAKPEVQRLNQILHSRWVGYFGRFLGGGEMNPRPAEQPQNMSHAACTSSLSILFL